MKKQQPTGRVSIYVKWSENFYGRLYPYYDSSADAAGELTEEEVRILKGMIHSYIHKCHLRHGNANIVKSIAEGDYL